MISNAHRDRSVRIARCVPPCVLVSFILIGSVSPIYAEPPALRPATDLGTFGGREAFAVGINDAGTIIGRAQNDRPASTAAQRRGNYRGFIKERGGPLIELNLTQTTLPIAINALGTVVYTKQYSNGAFNGVCKYPSDSSAPPECVPGLHAVDIDEQGNVLTSSAAILHADTGVLEPLPCEEAECGAVAMNESGSIVGWANRDGTTWPVLWKGPAHTLTVLPGHEPGRPDVEVVDINRDDVIVGQRDVGGVPWVVVWHGERHTLTEIGPGEPKAINDHGLIAGSSTFLRADAAPHQGACLWDLQHDNVRVALPGLTDHDEFSEARDVNNAGHAVGLVSRDGALRAVLFDAYVPDATR